MVVKAECPDWYDLTGSHVKCEIGPYSARQTGNGWTTQVVDFGPGEIQSRHTIHRDANEIDPRTTNNGTEPGLHTVPAGEIASVRLGNWLDGRVTGAANETGQAERITYTFTVDDDNKYLLMRYAIVWQDPHNHSDIVPSFQLETFSGATGNTLIPGACYNFDYDANGTQVDHTGEWATQCRICAYYRFGNEGAYYYFTNRYNQNGYGRTQGYYYQGDDVYYAYYAGNHVEDCPEFTYRHENQIVAWREWRTRLINLEDYVGQTVRLRFTSSDCGYVEHWGYSYFTLNCLQVNMYSPTCGGPTEYRTFTAPQGLGLNYMWYKVDENKNRLEQLTSETSNTLTVLNDGQMYECYIYSQENASCNISLYAKAEPRLPLPDFTIDKHEDCVDTVYLIDNSGVSSDGVTMLTPHEDVDVVTWDFGDGRTNATYSAGTPITYDNDGTYTITQIVKLNNGNCTDTLRKTVTVRGKMTKHESEVYDTICSGSKYTWNGDEYTTTGVYPYIVVNGAAGGFCDSIARLHLKVWDSYYRNDTVDALEGREIPYQWHSNGATRNLYSSGVYWDSCVSVHGCDSVYRLVLRVRPKYFFLEKDTICEGETYTYHKNGIGIDYTATGTYYDSLFTAKYGNDSVYCLQLYVRPAYHFSETRKFCQGDTIDFHGQRFWTDGLHTVSFKTTRGCDSIFTLSMIQQQKYLLDTIATISDKELPFNFHGRMCPGSGTYYDSLRTVNGCDSIIRLRLTVCPTYYFEDTPVTLCQGESYNFHNHRQITESGTYYDSLKTVYGYDSVYMVRVTVNPTYHITETAQIVEGGTYYFFGTPITAGGTYSQTFTTKQGCDSIITLILSVYPKYFIAETASICQGESYTYHKNGATVTYNTAGTYYDSLLTVHGYDSVYALTLTILPKYFYPDEHTICQGQEYNFHGRILKTAGTYYDSLKTQAGCDSIYRLDLHVNPTHLTRITGEICQGETYLFGTRQLSAAGIYRDTLHSVQHCDSVIELTLYVRNKYLIEETYSIGEGETYTWHGKSLTRAGFYYDSLSTVNLGCDSVYRLTLVVHPKYFFEDSPVTLCQGEYYDFHGHKQIGESGIYYDSLKTIHGYDSVYMVRVTVNPKYNVTITAQMPEGGSYSFFDQILTTGGTYTKTFTTQQGCDSIITLILSVYPKYFIPETASICQGETYTYHKNGSPITYSVGGTYYDSLKTVYGYDSVYALTLTILPKYFYPDEYTICQGQEYNFHGRILKNAGVYYDSLKTKAGCDSVYRLDLHVNPTYITPLRGDICQGETYLFGTRQLTESGVYLDTVPSVNNCDSVLRLSLYVHNRYTVDTVAHLCEGDTLQWYGRSLTQAGEYYENRTTTWGCDSIVHLRLYTHLTYSFTETQKICEGDYYEWHGQQLNTAGVHTLSLSTVYGCDSVYTLNLTVNPSYIKDTTAMMCTGDTYMFLGKPLTRGGYYVDTLPTKLGCDSIFRLTLNEYPKYFIESEHTICKGDAYPWRGKTLTAAGIYYDSLTSVTTGCDSVYKLTLRVNPTYVQEQRATICGNEYYNFNGTLLNQTGEYYDTIATVHNCDSIFHLYLTVLPAYPAQEITASICQGETYDFGGRSLTTGGLYIDSLTTVNGGCDSVVRLSLTVNPISRVPISRHICQGTSYNFHGRSLTQAGQYIDTLASRAGCDSIITLQLYVHAPYYNEISSTICANESYDFHGMSLNTSGDYTLPGQTLWGCDSTYTLHLTVNPTYTRDTVIHMCAGSETVIFGKSYNQGGHYIDTLHTRTTGCDSIFRITLIENLSSFIPQRAVFCKGSTYRWRGRDLTSPGVYYDSLTTVFSGCDSIYQLTLVMQPVFYEETTKRICANEFYTFHGNQYNQTGVYYDSLISVITGCDSIYKLNLTVDPTYVFTDRDTICEGESVVFAGVSRTTGGFYTDSLRSVVTGCDSVRHFSLTVKPKQRITRNEHICEGDFYDFKGMHLTTAGIYVDTLTAASGCDSIVTLHLYVHRVLSDTTTTSICEGDAYMFHGQTCTSPGRYTVRGQSMYGCDSTYVLNLSVKPSYITDTALTLCSGDYALVNGRIYDHGGTYYDTLQTAQGCDSVFRIRVNEYPKMLAASSVSFCRGDTVHWRGMDITTGGIYYDSLRSVVSGCDSVYQLTVVAKNPFYQEVEATILGTDYYDFNGRALREPGVYWDSLTSVITGCDSIYKLTLAVLPTYDITISHEMCDGDTYMFGGRTLTEGGLYIDTLKTIYNVDSIVRLSLTVYRQIVRETFVHISDQETYTWLGRTLNTTGVFDDTLQSVKTRCDSINRLHLYVHPTYLYEENQDICQGRFYNFRGRQYNVSGTYYDSLKTATWNYDSVYVLHLVVNPTYRHDTIVHICSGDYYSFNGLPLFEGGTYFDTIQTVEGCDSIFKLTLIKHPSNLIEEHKSICQGDYYDWHSKRLTSAGIYWDSLTSVVTGCDSIYKLTLNVTNTFYREIVDSLCSGSFYDFNGRQLSEPGIYWDSAHSVITGCDSIYRLQLTFMPSYNHTQRDTICEGESFMFDGHVYTHPGTYIDTIPTIQGCDSIRRLILSVHPVTVKENVVHLCQGETFTTPGGRVMSTSGLQSDTLSSVLTGCDSIIHSYVYVHSPFYDTLSITICQGEYYNFHGRQLSEARTYHDSLQTRWGCDSIYTLYLRVNPTYFSDTTQSLCEGDYVMFNGRPLYAGGVYCDTAQTINGCDSVLRMTLVMHPATYVEQTWTMCESDVYNWHGKQLTRAGIYWDSLHTAFGCDSIFKLTLNVTREFYQELNGRICSNEYYDFHGRQLNTPGVYWDSLRSLTSGCDSIYKLELTVYDAYDTTLTHTMCEGDYVMFNGRSLTEGGHYVDTLSSVTSGCDSVVRMILNVKPTLRRNMERHICQGDYCEFRGKQLTQAGSYSDTILSSLGCDSIVTLRLYVHSAFSQHLPITICQGEYYNFHGRLLSEPGTYYDSIQTEWGCDSIYSITLTVHPSYTRDTTVLLCDGDYYTFNGHTYTEGGFFIDTAQTKHGCDSIYRITVVRHPVSIVEETATICEGETYPWYNGRVLSRNAIYYDTIKIASGLCDSIIHRLHLTVQPAFYEETMATICSDAFYQFRGRSYNQTGIYYDSLQSQFGCDSVYCLKLTVHPASFVAIKDTVCEGETVWFGGKPLTTSGTYYDTIQTPFACDSIVQMVLTVNPVYHSFADKDICSGDSVWFGSRWIYSAGIYTDSLTTISGCDSIVRIHIHVHSNLYQERTETICEGDYYNFHGQLLDRAGTYENIMTSDYGCDSSYVLHLNIAPTYKHDVYAKICANEYYQFGGRPLNVGGVYTDTFKTIFGCDSIVTLHLSQYPVITTPVAVSICKGESYTWIHNGSPVELTNAGIYEDTLKSFIGGCDSIIRLSLTVHDNFYQEYKQTICANQYYNFHGRQLNESGVYWDSLSSRITGCDSVYKLELTVLPYYYIEIDTAICKGDFYEFRGDLLTEEGVYVDTMISIGGCDSIIRLTLHKHPRYYFEETKHICDGTTYSWHGKTLSRTGIYYDSLLSISNCDSVHCLKLYIDRTYYNTFSATICANEYYDFFGRMVNQPGVYRDTMLAASGCDSIFELQLNVLPSYFKSWTVRICDGDRYEFNGRFLTKTGTYRDTLQSQYGCDSIMQVTVISHLSYHFYDEQTICESDAYYFNGRPLSASGIYRDTFTTVNGCDSIYTLLLTVKHDFFEETNVSICSNERYFWQGRNYQSTGTYYDAYTTVAGCDSVYKLNLTVNPAYKFEESVYRCDLDNYWYNGRYLTKSGTYYDSLTTRNGCDSIHILHLVITPTRRDTNQVALCMGEVYDYYGTPLTQSGFYRDTVNDPVTRQCVITMLDLSFTAPTVVSNILVDEVCADDQAFTVHCYYSGGRPKVYSLIFDSKARSAGFVDQLDRPYTDDITGEIPSFEGNAYLRPDYYTATLILDNLVCNNTSQNTHDIKVLVKYPSWIIEQNWNDVVALLNDRYNGGYVFSDYEWYVNGNLSTEKGPYIYMPQTLGVGDEVYVAPTRQGEDYSVPSCPIVIYDKTPELVSDFPVLCNTTPIRGQFQIHAHAEGTYTLISSTGVVLSSGSYRNGDDLTINTRVSSGCYLLRLETEQYGSRVVKLILH
jgi:hypothetical protein